MTQSRRLIMALLLPIMLDSSSCILSHYQDDLFELDQSSANYYIDCVDDEPIHKDGEAFKIAIMGDSRAALGKQFTGIESEVYNLGVPGATTWSIRNKLYRIESIRPDFVFVFTGINDRNFMRPEEFKDNLMHISTYLTSRNIKCVIVDQLISPSLYPLVQDKFSQYRAMMDEIPFADYMELNCADSWFVDYCHLSEYGYQEASNKINQYIEHNR